MTAEDPALAELKKQTRIMQRKESAQGAVGGFILGLFMAIGVFFYAAANGKIPDDPYAAIFLFVAFPVIFAIVGGRNPN